MINEHFKLFNKTYFEFLEFIKKYLNNDSNFKAFYRKNYIIKETNIKLLIKTWNMRITEKYYNEIIEKNFNFFLVKSYSDDIKEEQNTPLLKYISEFKIVFPTLEDNVKNEFLNYITNLTKLSYLYYNI
jgi:hypothetical protein